MRKFLVKHFVLDYSINLFGKKYNGPRASRIIFPTMVITGLQVAFNDNYPTPDTLLWISYFITLVVLFFGFVYFRIKPAKWEELDNKQKIQAGHFLELTPEQFTEWMLLKKVN
jgi:hypothetical protein